MESAMERGDQLNSSAVPCIARHKCHACQRVRSVRVRVLSWVLGKLSLILVIILTSAATTLAYHRLWPADVTSGEVTSWAGARHETRHTDLTSRQDVDVPSIRLDEVRPVVNRGPGLDQVSSLTAARLRLFYTSSVSHIGMSSEGPQFFTSGHLAVDGGALVIQRATTLFLSADVVLSSMAERGGTGPTTVVVCLSLVRGDDPEQKPITCRLTYLRQRDQQMARVWMLFQAEANDRVYVMTSYPTYVISDKRNRQQSVFQAFEV